MYHGRPARGILTKICGCLPATKNVMVCGTFAYEGHGNGLVARAPSIALCCVLYHPGVIGLLGLP